VSSIGGEAAAAEEREIEELLAACSEQGDTVKLAQSLSDKLQALEDVCSICSVCLYLDTGACSDACCAGFDHRRTSVTWWRPVEQRPSCRL
jgi:hypothetical protein